MQKIIRPLIFFLTSIQYIRFVFQTIFYKSCYQKNWTKTYNLLKQSTFWQNKIATELTDNKVTYYSDYEKILNESFALKTNLLNNEEILYWSQSSGTTGAKKSFPITASFKKQFQITTPPLLFNVLRNFKNFLKFPVLYLADTNPVEMSPAGIGIGLISNYNYRNIPKLLKQKYVLPEQVLANVQTFKTYAHLYAVASPMSGIFAVTPLAIETLIKRTLKDWPNVISQLQDEKFWQQNSNLPMPTISAQRLAFLKNLKPKTLKDIWPELDFICCWKTSVCFYQWQNIKEEVGNIVNIDATYSASEGWFNVPFANPNKNGGVIHPNAVLLEFLPEQHDPNHIEKQLLKPWEIEVGKKYIIHLTNVMGLVRYNLHDVVLCTGKFFNAPIVEFLYKSSSQISLGLFTIGENELLEALNIQKITTSNLIFAPDEIGKNICIYSSNSQVDWENAVTKIDQYLVTINDSYRVYKLKNDIKVKYKIVAEDLIPKPLHNQTKPKFLYQNIPF